MKAKKHAEDMSRFASIVVDATRDLQWNKSTVYTNPAGGASATPPEVSGVAAIPSLVPPELGVSSSDPDWERWQKKEWARFVAARSLREARKNGLRNRNLYSIREDAYPTYEESKPTRDLLEYQRHAYNRLSAYLDKVILDGDMPAERNKSKAKAADDGAGEEDAMAWDEVFRLIFGREIKARPAPAKKGGGGDGDDSSSSDSSSSSSSDSDEDEERMKMLRQAVTEVKPTQWANYDDTDAKKAKKAEKRKKEKKAKKAKKQAGDAETTVATGEGVVGGASTAAAMTDEEKKKLEEERKERKKLKRQRQKQKKEEERLAKRKNKKRKATSAEEGEEKKEGGGEAEAKKKDSDDSDSDDEEEKKQERKKKKRKTEEDKDSKKKDKKVKKKKKEKSTTESKQ